MVYANHANNNNSNKTQANEHLKNCLSFQTCGAASRPQEFAALHAHSHDTLNDDGIYGEKKVMLLITTTI